MYPAKALRPLILVSTYLVKTMLHLSSKKGALPPKNTTIRRIINILYCVLLAIILSNRVIAEDAASPVTVSGNDNVVSVGQIGGITARVVTIYQDALNPEFLILSRQDIVNKDGAITVILDGEVKSSITPGLLIIQIETNNLINAHIASAPVNGISHTFLRNVSLFKDRVLCRDTISARRVFYSYYRATKF